MGRSKGAPIEKSELEVIFENIQKFRSEHSGLLIAALRDGLTEVKKYTSSNKYLSRYHSYPELNFHSNGMPYLSNPLMSGPIEYRGCFGSQSDGKVNSDNIKSFNDLVAYVRNRPDLANLMLPGYLKNNPKLDELDIEFDKLHIVGHIKSAIESYIHTYNDFDFSEINACKIIEPLLKKIYDYKLSVDICIPILFIHFDCAKFEINENIIIERISDELHLARFGTSHINSNHLVKSCATHQLVLKNWEIKNTKDLSALNTPQSYPLEIIDKFFAVMQIVAPYATGYAQIYCLAKGWTGHTTANLPYTNGTTVRSYPSNFDNFYWNVSELPRINFSDLEAIKKYFNLASNAKENSIKLSLSRLSQCSLRDNEQDGIIDATIALEALLTDNGTTEMTHKLALRVAALCKLDSSFNKKPQEAFKDIKSVYSYRSAIVHGSTAIDKKRVIKAEGKKDLPVHGLAIDYLRFVIKVLLEHSIYREAVNIDRILLLGEKSEN